jgi:hypothetical protein
MNGLKNKISTADLFAWFVFRSVLVVCTFFVIRSYMLPNDGCHILCSIAFFLVSVSAVAVYDRSKGDSNIEAFSTTFQHDGML